MTVKNLLKKSKLIVSLYLCLLGFRQMTRGFFLFRPLQFLKDLAHYLKDYSRYRRGPANPRYSMAVRDWSPCLTDRTEFTPVEPVYFYQDTWVAGKIFQLRPARHYDVGSSIKAMGMISQFVPTTMVDIRPPDIQLNNFSFIRGSILALPFEDNSIESLSSLCVVEHIGLGRYGDPIDTWGTEKAIKELRRVLKSGGNLLFSVPVDMENRVYFNAHRAFAREYIIELFQGMNLVEEKYIYGTEITGQYDRARGFGTGLYHFVKEKR